MKPVRIQRKREKGWKMPPNTVYVGRPTKWGNPFRITDYCGGDTARRQWAVADFRMELRGRLWTEPNVHTVREELRGKNLACWCPLDQPCHADVLLEIANE